jgi:excisionase family DNA binding protein
MTLIERLKVPKKPMTVKEVAEELGYHIMTIYDWTQEGKIPFMRLGGRLKFDGRRWQLGSMTELWGLRIRNASLPFSARY